MCNVCTAMFVQKVYRAAIGKLQDTDLPTATAFCPLLNISVCPIAKTAKVVSAYLLVAICY